ncbi:flavocytochrome c [Desulfitobacterium hafniense DP7]|uniref:Urocanate reductase n=1 Tax=Desulfitobacterium hafniense DP7 TaxID=537010 RepID=G9XWR1_DESHA|nr:FAD-binding protein [Desulfitobacterium hafniense]EHL03936.1 flavocytochrome c [Desulfitobacterium hafniense DP7]
MKKTKVISILAVLLCLTLGLSGCAAAPAGAGNPAPEKGGIVPGDYLGVGNGRNGSIVVKVTLGADSIDAIKVVSEKETYNTGSVPIKQYPDLIVQNQTLDLDVVSGATISSAAFLNAVRNAITQAGGDPAKFAGKVAADVPHEDTTADVVVVGAGGAGMTAAISAANEGKKVILLEKLGIVGGTSNYSIESFGAIGDKTHVALGSDVTPEEQAATLTKQNPKGTAEAFGVLTGNNGAAADWLRSIGAQLTVAGGQISSTASREVGEFGNTIVSALKAECEKAGVDVRVNSKATELVMKDGVVDGVKVSTKLGDYTISAKAVVIASGGFGANKEMVAEYAPTLKDYKSSCSPGGTGDGHLMAQAAGADLKNMDYIRVNFTYTTAENGYFYYMGSLFNTGAIFVNKDGQRFVNDQGGYGVGPQVVAQGGSGWAVFDNSLVAGVKDVREYEKLGLFVSADSIEELADKIGVNKENLVKTINNYQGYVAAGKDEEFGRAMLNMTFDEAPYYAAPMTCRVQGTFGGIDTDVNTQVLKADGTPIPGLFAAGECANDGTWGANPAAVNVVFGRIAGQNAAAYVK